MPCDTQLRKNQTITERKSEVKSVVERVAQRLMAGSAKVQVGPQGAVVFTGLSDAERAGVTDACIYRRIMVSGTALQKAKIAQAEQIAGRSINKQIIGQGAHSHDGGRTWHDHKG